MRLATSTDVAVVANTSAFFALRWRRSREQAGSELLQVFPSKNGCNQKPGGECELVGPQQLLMSHLSETPTLLLSVLMRLTSSPATKPRRREDGGAAMTP
ncbi:hypothetical protein PG985_007881 [Apiospora marii]|uniref:Uncharacterized protein n=1 Tax=Apiospora marii TaxID=335849 RepID=A0ABR1R9R6_9PEZI